MAPTTRRRTTRNSDVPMTSAQMLRTLNEGIRKQATRPNLYAYAPHEKQRLFHKSTKHKKLYIGGNRCLAEDTLVLMADGIEKAIKDIVVGEYVIAGDGSKTEVTAVWDNGFKECNEYIIGRYQDQFSVICTPEHEFLSAIESHGILKNFKKNPIGRLVNSRGRHKIQRSLGTSTGHLSESRAFVLGLMLGDGHFGDTPGRMQFTCADIKLIEEFNDVFKQSYGIQYKFVEPTEWFEWFDELGLIGTRSSSKFIPKEVWNWTEESIAELCAGLLVTDGSFYSNQNMEYHVAYCSNSLAMIQEFRRLMGLRLGIWGSTITYESRGTYSVTYGTREALGKISRLPIRGIKEERTGFYYVKNSFSSHVGIKKEIPVGFKHTYDITVKHNSHTFMLANGLITSNSGKSTGGVVEDIFWAMGRHPFRAVPPAPTFGRVCAVDFIQGVDKIILPEFARWVPPSFLRKGSFEQSYDKLLRTLTFENGSTIEFMSYDQALEKFAGTARHFTHYDEEPPHHIFNECEARLIDFNGTSWITMTPVEGMTWVFDDIYNKGKDGDHPDIEVIEVSIHDNPYVSEEAVERILGSYDADERKARERGQFVELGGRVFKEFAKETHVISPVVPPRNWEWYCSIDHGFNNPTAMLWHAVSRDNRVITFSEHYKSEMTVKEHAAVYHARNAGFNRIPDIVCGDPAMHQRSGISGTSIVQEYAEHGVYIATEGIPRDVQAGVNRMTQYLRLNPENEAHWNITENCDALINEMLRLRWQTWATRKGTFENNKKEKIHKKDDHAADSSRYFFTMLPDLTPEEVVDHTAMDRWAKIQATVGTSVQGAAISGSWDELLKNRVKTEWKTQEFGDLFGLEYD